MDVSELRKRIIRALDDARKDAGARRATVDAARNDFAAFLENVAVPLMRQAANVLRAENHRFSVETPNGQARLSADGLPETFVELVLDVDAEHPHVLGRVSVTRGRQGVVLEEREIGGETPIAELGEDVVAAFLVEQLPKIVLKRSS